MKKGNPEKSKKKFFKKKKVHEVHGWTFGLVVAAAAGNPRSRVRFLPGTNSEFSNFKTIRLSSMGDPLLRQDTEAAYPAMRWLVCS